MSNKVLIVDDEPHIRLLLEQTLDELEDLGVELLTAKNGGEALELVRSERPQVVLLDVMMPVMNGFDVCRKIKDDAELASTYVVLLTAKGQEFDRGCQWRNLSMRTLHALFMSPIARRPVGRLLTP